MKTEQDSRGSSVTDKIAGAITDAIIEHRLAAGTKLGEQHLAKTFEVSRTIVRQAFYKLERDKLIKLEPAKGASVATPSVQETKQVFATRRFIEIPMIAEFAKLATAANIKTLRKHLKLEQQSCLQTDVRGRTRLLADFHVVIAQTMGNLVLAEVIGQLVGRTSLAAMLYQTKLSAKQSSDEHVELLNAVEDQNPNLAAKIMLKHLNNVEASLHLDEAFSNLHLALVSPTQTH